MDGVTEAGAGAGQARESPRGHTSGWLAGALGIAVVLVMAAGLVLWVLTENRGGPALIVSGVAVEGLGRIVLFTFTLSVIALTAIGVAIASRVPKNAIGWILLAVGAWAGLTFFLASVLSFLASQVPGRTDLADISVWLGRWTFVPVITLPITFALMLVPDGRLPSARWRVLPWLAVIGTASWATREAFGQDSLPLPMNPYPNPTLTAVADVAALALVPAFVGSAASIVVRFRRADQQSRQQIKWVAFGGALEVIVTLVLWTLSAVRPAAFGAAAIAVGGVSGLAVPVANGVAILRYRLYDIDRLINRTVTYGAAVGVLAVIYALVAIGIPQVLDLPGDSPLLVATATLVSFAVFRPATRGIQSALDRRFNRARYDARREVEGFSSQLTHRVAMDEVISVTTALLDRTLQPDELGVWIRDPVAGGNLR